MLTDDERKALVSNKVRRSRETWEETKGIIENGYWYAAANRIIGLFGLHFIKTRIISGDLGKFYSQLFELRQTGDYDDWKVVAESDIVPLIPMAEDYLDALENLIRKDGYL